MGPERSSQITEFEVEAPPARSGGPMLLRTRSEWVAFERARDCAETTGAPRLQERCTSALEAL